MTLAPERKARTGICPYFGKDILTRSQAKRVAKRDARRTRENIVAYECRTCGGWHVGCRRFG